MFSVTGSLLVKPRVRGEAQSLLSNPCCVAVSVVFHPDVCCHLQLLEDVEETLSCAVFEEDYLLRKLDCEYIFVDVLFCFDIFSFRMNDFV